MGVCQPRRAAYCMDLSGGHLGQLLAAGVFPPAFAGPDVPRCADCAFRHACRIDHLRQRRVAEGAWGGLWPVPRPIAEELIGAEGGEAE